MSGAKKTVIAVDLGAESGRVMAVAYTGSTLQIQELQRFPNIPVAARGVTYWDMLRLWRDIQDGIAKGRALDPASIGVDAWGVDFGLLDRTGALLGNPVHYRDRRTDGMMEHVFARVPRAEVFAQTGIQFMPINTLYQIMSLVAADAPQLQLAETFLTIPDLLNYWLTGARVCEFTNATTTQLFNPRSGAWATDLMDALGIPARIFPSIVQPGTRLGAYEGIPVIAVACHDTGSAVAAVPTQTPSYAYISSGTWSLVGLETIQPIITPAALEANVTNEGGVGGTNRLLKNVMGLWIVQQCRATWAAAGHSYTYAELMQLAQQAPALESCIPPDDPRFLPPGDHPRLVRQLCAECGVTVPQSHGAIVRCVLESLALAYRSVLDTLRALADQPIDAIHIIGGGVQNELLCQMTANATGLPVLAGPVEATVLGNAVIQLMALGELADIREARQLVATMAAPRRYEPQDADAWQAAYQRYQQIGSGRS
jgi:rhamnulokinase